MRGKGSSTPGMAHSFKSIRDFEKFAESVRNEWRYIRDREQQTFLDAVLTTSESRRETIPAGTILWRARMGCDYREDQVGADEWEQTPIAFSPKDMKPRPFGAEEGRVNPKGIRVLYTASVRDTAIAEVRPWIGSLVSAASLSVVRPLQIVNCSLDTAPLTVYWTEPDEAERERANWGAIDRAFAQPVARHEHLASYVPTQVIAELFRSQGLDGILYRSSLGPGHNVALFQIDDADVTSCALYYVRSVRFDVSEAGDSYVVSKHLPTLHAEE
jgi:RES domain-containing protein